MGRIGSLDESWGEIQVVQKVGYVVREMQKTAALLGLSVTGRLRRPKMVVTLEQKYCSQF
jgi:hypothetical protein